MKPSRASEEEDRSEDPIGLSRRLVRVASVATVAVVAVACGKADDTLVAVSVGSPPPVRAQLDAIYRPNHGLLTGVDDDGDPTTTGSVADPAIVEALRFYDTLRTPFPQPVPVGYPDPFTGESTPTRLTAPMTLDDWKRVFEQPPALDGEGLQAFRDRVGIAVYYNRNELGLGRQLGCSRFVDGYDATGAPMMGVACFVTNHGPGFRQERDSLQAAMKGSAVRNTVCITYRPTMDPGYQVQFYVYGPAGRRQEWARLDTLGPRPHPYVCTNCHGGAYDDARHLTKNAHFLPLDPAMVTFGDGVSDGAPLGLTRAGQEERIRVVNEMASETPLTPAQQGMLGRLYADSIRVSGVPATGDDVPEAWAQNAADHDFYREVLKPYCATCHLAGQRQLAAENLPSYDLFASPAAFDGAHTEAFVCNSFVMPNAQPTSLGFWEADGNPGLTIAGTFFPTAADAYLARRGLDRATCQGFAQVSGCNHGPDPDALCGGAVNGGAICDTTSGRCVPMSSALP